MDDPRVVGFLQGLCDVGDDAQGLVGRELSDLVESVLEGLADQVFHHEVGLFLVEAEVVHLHDMRASNAGDGSRFPDEALLGGLRERDLTVEELDGDLRAEMQVLRKPHLSRRPLAQRLHEAELTRDLRVG